MKEELKIAKENIEKRKGNQGFQRNCEEHKQSCQRFLDFLEELLIDEESDAIHIQVEDLKETIKLYEDNRI